LEEGEKMGTVERFEDLIAWQKARVLSKEIYNISQIGALSRDFGLRDQMQRAAVSVMSNVAEGFERMHPAEFHQFICTAKASCAELRSQLYLAMEVGYIDAPIFEKLQTLAEEVGRILGGLRNSIQRRREGR
jgi:four helix bundle protein